MYVCKKYNVNVMYAKYGYNLTYFGQKHLIVFMNGYEKILMTKLQYITITYHRTMPIMHSQWTSTF